MDQDRQIPEQASVDRLKDGSKGLLTRREAIVASLLIDDYSVDEIAELLSRAKDTIKMHIKNMKRKCGCETRTGLGAALQSFLKNNPQGYIQIGKNDYD